MYVVTFSKNIHIGILICFEFFRRKEYLGKFFLQFVQYIAIKVIKLKCIDNISKEVKEGKIFRSKEGYRNKTRYLHI